MYSFIIVSIRIKYENCIIVYIVEVIMKLFLRKIKVLNIVIYLCYCIIDLM